MRPIEKEMRAIAEQLQGHRDALAKREEELKQELGAVHAELVRIDKVIRAAMNEPKAVPEAKGNGRGPGTRAKKRGGPARVAAWREDEVARVAAAAGEPVTIAQVGTELGWKNATTKLAVDQARARGLIRLVGTAGNAKLYAAMDGGA